MYFSFIRLWPFVVFLNLHEFYGTCVLIIVVMFLICQLRNVIACIFSSNSGDRRLRGGRE